MKIEILSRWEKEQENIKNRTVDRHRYDKGE